MFICEKMQVRENPYSGIFYTVCYNFFNSCSGIFYRNQYFFNLFSGWGTGGEGKKLPLTGFSPVTSTNVGITGKKFLTF